MNRVLFSSLLAVLFCANEASAQLKLPIVGGDGGGPFQTQCPAGQMLFGLSLRVADDIDAVRPICVSVPARGSVANERVIDPWRGGNGGAVTKVTCPISKPVVIGAWVEAEGHGTLVVNAVSLYCGVPYDLPAPPPNVKTPDAFYRGPQLESSATFGLPQSRHSSMQLCPPEMIATGIHGRHGAWLDAFAVTCARPPLSFRRVR